MIQRRILTIAALILFFLPLNSFAGGWGKNGWTGVWLTRDCVGDDLVYYLNIGMGNGFVAQKILTLAGYCKCKKSSAREGDRPHQLGDFCLFSIGLNGGPQPNSNTQVAVAAGGGGGPAGPTPALRPALEGIAQTAFTPTVPYRSFPFSTYVSSATPQSSGQGCDASVNPSGFMVFHQDGDVVRTNMCTGDVLATIPVTSNPLQIQVTPDGTWALVTSYDNAISFIDTNTNKVANVIHTDLNTFPSGLAISSDGSFALVTSYIDDHPALLVVDIPKQAIISRIPLDTEYPQSVFLSPDGTLAWVTYPFDNVVEVIDVMTGAVDRSIPVQEPIDVAFSPNSSVAYISSRVPGSVAVINTTTYSQIKNIATAFGSSDLSLSPDGGFLTVNNFDDNSISVIDTSSLALVNTTPVGGQPVGTTLVPVK